MLYKELLLEKSPLVKVAGIDCNIMSLPGHWVDEWHLSVNDSIVTDAIESVRRYGTRKLCQQITRLKKCYIRLDMSHLLSCFTLGSIKLVIIL